MQCMHIWLVTTKTPVSLLCLTLFQSSICHMSLNLEHVLKVLNIYIKCTCICSINKHQLSNLYKKPKRQVNLSKCYLLKLMDAALTYITSEHYSLASCVPSAKNISSTNAPIHVKLMSVAVICKILRDLAFCYCHKKFSIYANMTSYKLQTSKTLWEASLWLKGLPVEL